MAARQRARTTEDLYLFSRKLAGTGTLDDVLWATAFQIASMLKVRVVLLLPEDGTIAVKAGYPPDDTLVDADIAAARWAWEHNRAAGRGADTLPGAKRLYLPLRTGRTAIGVVGLDDDRQGPLLTPEQQRLLDALADQAAVAIERIQLVADVDRAKLAAEADRLRSALLTSISHDLKTPLAAIMGAAGTLREFSQTLPETDRGDLLSTVLDESERLNRFIANLLDMTRIESGAMEPNYALHYVGDIVGSALRRAAKITARHRIEIDLPADLPMLRLDPVLFEQVLFNLLDNAAKYAPAGVDHPHPGLDRRRLRARCRSSTRGRASRPTIWSASSTRSTGCARAITCAPAPGLACRSAAASSRRWAARSRRQTGPTAPAPSSRSGCRCRRTRRSLDELT